MIRKHLWNWLPNRVSRIRPANPSLSGAPRPPLAMLEQLEDRVLLSVVNSEGTEAILIGLLRGQIDLRAAEIEFLKLAGDLIADKTSPLIDTFVKIEADFLKIEGALFKLTEWSLSEQKHKQDFLTVKLTDVIVSSFSKIESELKLGGGKETALLLPAVQKVREAASRALGSLSEIGDIKLDGKVAAQFLRIENVLWKVGAITEKWTSDSLYDKLNKGADDRIDVKLTDAFVKLDDALAAFGDGSVFKALAEDLATLEANTFNFVDTFGSPIIITTDVTLPTTDDRLV
jgi:hypothetical protein